MSNACNARARVSPGLRWFAVVRRGSRARDVAILSEHATTCTYR